MLSFISWPQYFAGLLLIGIAYYGFVLAKYYREEVLAFVRPKPLLSVTTTKPLTGEVIGSIKANPGESSVSAEDLQFPDEETTVVDEVVNEIRALINAFKGLDQKDEFLSLLSLILSRYAGAGIDQPIVTEQVLVNSHSLSFTVDEADMETAWQNAA